jgi:DNA-binding NtrC family response regulator
MSEEIVGPAGDSAADGRNLDLLFQAVSVAQEELMRTNDPTKALNESFTYARSGLGAEIGVLLYVRDTDPLRLESLFSFGLSDLQVRACETRERIVPGLSPSVIQDSIDRRETIYIPNALQSADASRTASLADGSPHSVLCAPIIDQYTKVAIGVLYFQQKDPLRGFQEREHQWLKSYALAIGWGFGAHLAQIRRAAEFDEERRRLERKLRNRTDAPAIIGNSVETARIRELLDENYLHFTTRPDPAPILITGDSGTGKDMIAKYLYYYSPVRSKGPWVEWNCASLGSDRGLVHSTLFGNTKNSFTGAADTPGLFRSADRGVLFLDEFAAMSIEAQGMLLRVIETKLVQPLGQVHPVHVDVQLILATNEDLDAAVAAGRFRPDLYARISAARIRLKPLGVVERRADIQPLIAHFLAVHERDLQKKTGGLTPEATKQLLQYGWPMNVREISNVCMTLVLNVKPGEKIDVGDIERYCPAVLNGPRHPAPVVLWDDMSYADAMQGMARELILRRLELHGGKRKATAQSLGLPESTFYRYMLRMGIGLAEQPTESETAATEAAPPRAPDAQ